MKQCPYCGSWNDDDSWFCEECGFQFPQIAACPRCGAPVESGSKFCVNCGYNMAGYGMPAMPAAPAAPPAMPYTPSPLPPPEAGAPLAVPTPTRPINNGAIAEQPIPTSDPINPPEQAPQPETINQPEQAPRQPEPTNSTEPASQPEPTQPEPAPIIHDPQPEPAPQLNEDENGHKSLYIGLMVAAVLVAGSIWYGLANKTPSQSEDSSFITQVEDMEYHFGDGTTCHYSGPVVDGLPNGLGKVAFDDGAIYVGPFVNGKMEGPDGHYSSADYSIDSLTMHNNEPASGIMRWPDGSRFVGTFRNWEILDGTFTDAKGNQQTITNGQ